MDLDGCSRSRTPLRPSLGAFALLALAACARSPQRQQAPAPVAARASRGDSDLVVLQDAAASPLRADVAEAPLASDAAVAPLFAAMPCAAIIAARSTTNQSVGFFSIGQRQLSAAELHARPWLWGQTGSGCVTHGFAPTRNDSPAAVDEGPTEARARAIAQHYLHWSRVDDELRWAPYLCRLPMAASLRADLDSATAPHGRKVYYLYARHRLEYISGREAPAQVVVKEAWRPHEIARSEAVRSQMRQQCVGEGDRCFEPGDFAGLYIMMRQANRASNERTDDGWTYATVDPRGTVTAAGVIESCVGCHRRAPHGRLFGVTGGHGG